MNAWLSHKNLNKEEKKTSIYRQLCVTVAKVPLGEYKVTHRFIPQEE